MTLRWLATVALVGKLLVDKNWANQIVRLNTPSLHQCVLDALDGFVLSHSPLADKPFELNLKFPLPSRIRLYLYNLTSPPGGRTLGEHKIQLIAPGQQRGRRGNFDFSDARVVVLSGYETAHDVFVLWDAGLYTNFPYSMNVQVRAETVFAAFTGDIVHQPRRLHSGQLEMVTVTPSARLPRALQERASQSLERLLSESSR